MNRILIAASLTLSLLGPQSNIVGAQQADRQAYDRPVQPFQIFDNLYYVGFESACAWY
jgi:hypothetical protein